MPANCMICRKSAIKGLVTMHRFPPVSKPEKHAQWLKALNLKTEDIKSYNYVCSRHFLNGDASNNLPTLGLGKRFTSPIKLTDRGNRARKRQKLSFTPLERTSVTPIHSTPVSSGVNTDDDSTNLFETTPESEVFLSDMSTIDIQSDNTSDPSHQLFAQSSEGDSNVIVNRALVARIEHLERKLKLSEKIYSKKEYFRLADIADKDSLVHFYTGFASYQLLMSFFKFLGPSVNCLNYWGDKSTAKSKRRKKLDPIDQLLLTLIKLRQNLKERDLAFRFGIAASTVSKYFITWVCFLYSHLKEINWMPDVEQIKATLPLAFRDQYSSTYTIIDASEVFLETPSDLQCQSSTWSNYKHHNTAKILVACTPNGAVNFVSDVYVGSISDVELTRVCGLIQKLSGKRNISVMADRGFTIRDQLKQIDVELNIPPFMEGRIQLPNEEVLQGRQIASLRIHVERVIGRIKNFAILKQTIPITLSRLTNQIVCVCAWLVNFQPILIPPCSDNDEDTIMNNFIIFF